MGIFDFFRNIGKEKETKKAPMEKVSLAEIDKWIDSKNEEIGDGESKLFSLIKEKINILERSIENKLNILNEFDINSRKSEDRIKSVVEESRKKYVEKVTHFMMELENLRNGGIEKMIGDINRIFIDFNKKSYMSYEKATFLIGKEMSDVKEEIKSFSKDVVNIFNENKDITDLQKTINNIKLKLKQKEESESDMGWVGKTISFLKNEVIQRTSESDMIKKEIENVKKSTEYLENLSRIKKINSLKEELMRDFVNLGQTINFKALSNFYHIFDDKMKTVKIHKDKFQTSYEKDNGETIINLLNNASLNNESISDKVKHINEKRVMILALEDEKVEDKVSELDFEITKIVNKINELKTSIEKEEKKFDKLNSINKEILNDIRKEFVNIGVDFLF